MFNTQLIMGIVGISALAVGAIDLVIPEPQLEPTITVNSIRIWEDGTTFYDRETKEGTWNAWSGTILKHDYKSKHCNGGDSNQYFNEDNPLGSEGVDWLVGDDCKEGLEVGMPFSFSWVSVGGKYATVTYPPEGYLYVEAGTIPPELAAMRPDPPK